MRVRSFFTNVRGQISENGKPDPLGRYLAICLQEALRENLKLLSALFPESKARGAVEVLREHCYLGTADRRADLALVDRDERAIVLVEVKVEDRLTAAQAESYRKFVKKHGCALVLLTRHPLTPSEKTSLDGCVYREISTNDLYRIARAHADGSPVTVLLTRYLEENEMIYTRYIDDSLALLVNRVFFGSARNAKVNLADVTEKIPDTVASLFATLQFLGAAIRKRVHFPTTHRKKWTKVTLDMQYYPFVALGRLDSALKRAKKDNETELSIWQIGGANRSGVALYYASLQVSDSSDQTYLCVGVRVTTEKGDRPQVELVTWVAPDRDPWPADVVVKRLPYSRANGAWDLGAEQDVLAAVVKSLRKSVRTYIREYKDVKPGNCRPQRKRVAILEDISIA